MGDTNLTHVVRIVLLCVALAYAGLVIVLALTPVAWEAAGRPRESYPELFYIAFGWPSALALLLATGLLWAKQRRHSIPAACLLVIGLTLIVGLCTLVAASGFLSISQSLWTPSGIIDSLAALAFGHFYALLLAATVSVIVGVVALRGTPQRAA